MTCSFIRYTILSAESARYSIKRHTRYIRASLQFFRTNDEPGGERESMAILKYELAPGDALSLGSGGGQGTVEEPWRGIIFRMV